MKKAFSLIELLIALIIISIITASFAPTLTRQLKNRGVSISQKGLGFDKCTEIDEKCEICIGNICYGCSKDCNNNQYKDVAKCKCIDCKTKYGTNCLTCNNDTCKSCPSGFTPTQDGCLSCSVTYGAACTSCNTSQCTYCKAGYGYNPTAKQCYPCGENEYSTGGLGECSICGTGTKVNASKNGCDAIIIDTPKPTCSDNEYRDGNSCKSCLTYHPRCTKCNSVTCTECQEGYIDEDTAGRYRFAPGKNYGCLKKVTADVCKTKFDGIFEEQKYSSPALTIGLCATKRNIGYGANSSAAKYKEIDVPSAAGVTKAKIGTKCALDASITAKCCWYGTTGDSGVNTADSGSDDLKHKASNNTIVHTYTYSALKRTVCNLAAAEAICEAYDKGNMTGYWRLGHGPFSYSFLYPVIGSDENMQLCLDYVGTAYMKGLACKSKYGKCLYKNGTKADCHPGDYSKTTNISGGADYLSAFSVRCNIMAYPSL